MHLSTFNQRRIELIASSFNANKVALVLPDVIYVRVQSFKNKGCVCRLSDPCGRLHSNFTTQSLPFFPRAPLCSALLINTTSIHISLMAIAIYLSLPSLSIVESQYSDRRSYHPSQNTAASKLQLANQAQNPHNLALF